MVELKGLEDWARGILATSKTELNRRYGTWKRSDEFSQSIEAMPFYSRYRPVFLTLSEPTLRELHRKMRGQKCENNFWDALLRCSEHQLPDEIALDLIERGISTGWLAHSSQSDAVYWRLVPDHSDAILTLAKRAYTDSGRTSKEFQHVLNEAPELGWVLEFVAQWSASSLEKRRVFEAAVEGNPRREAWFDINPKIEPNQSAFSSFDLNYLSDEERLKTFYSGYNFEQLLEMGRDDATPDEILHELENFPSSREVRFVARHNLRRRNEVDEEAQLNSLP